MAKGALRGVPRKVGRVLLCHSKQEDYSLYPDASLYERLCAFVIDFTFLGTIIKVVALLLGVCMAGDVLPSSQQQVVLNFMAASLGFIFYTLQPLLNAGQTIGKKALGIRMISVKPAPDLGPVMVFLREVLGKLSGVLVLATMVAYICGHRRLLHDYVFDTRVIKYPPLLK